MSLEPQEGTRKLLLEPLPAEQDLDVKIRRLKAAYRTYWYRFSG